MVNYDEVCLNCGYPRGSHTRDHLAWSIGVGEKARKVEFWQDDVCPWLHNMTQPPWDIYLFRSKEWYAVSNQPEWSKR